jgi:MinD-like ATPase involved in chromosome partitioning or flagellar assembly
VLARKARVLLVDLDLHNQGATGLFVGRYPFGSTDTVSLLRDPGLVADRKALARIHDRLFFLPSGEDPSAADYSAEEFTQRLETVIERLHEIHEIDCFVFDCHGGIDETNMCIAGIASHTIVITEPDTVTFTGTLALIDSFSQRYEGATRLPRIHYVVNRVHSKYRWADLQRLYAVLLQRRLGEFTPDSHPLAFIPAEDYVAESFGEYPFQSELAPSSLFSRKLELVLHRLLAVSHPDFLADDILARFRRSSYARRIERRIDSQESRCVRTVLYAYPLTVIYYFCAMLPLVLWSGWESPESVASLTPLILLLLGAPMLILMGFVAIRCFIYFRDKLRFQAALLRRNPAQGSRWTSLTLWKWRLLYAGTVVPLILGALTALSLLSLPLLLLLD